MATERKMSPKGFLAKSNGKAAASAIGFLAAYREYLLNGEVSYATRPIIDKLDKGELLPTPALTEIKVAVMGHIMATDLLHANEAAEKAQNPTVSKTSKPFVAVIRDGSGRIIQNDKGEDMRQTFELPQRAQDWCDRRLFESTSDCFGEITHTKASNPAHAVDLVNREDSIARILKRPGRPVIKVNSPAQTKLGFGVKAVQSKAAFSRG